jgi:hypothetical protein
VAPPEEIDMDDRQILQRIHDLVAEEHSLEGQPAHALSAEETIRLSQLEVELDQAWDLLRQRRARRHAGEDPDAVAPRPASVVEGYEQ